MIIKVSYHRDAVMSYGNAHWNNYNTAEYRTWTGVDCTNFASQCLRYGGYPDRRLNYSKYQNNCPPYLYNKYLDWWYDSNTSWADTWPSAQSLRLHLSQNKGVPRFESITWSDGSKLATATHKANLLSLQRGDLVFAMNSDGTCHHASIVKYVETVSGVVKIHVYAHDTNRGSAATDGWTKALNLTLGCKLSDYIVTQETYDNTASLSFLAAGDSSSKVYQEGASGEHIRNMQKRLHMLGFDVNGIDGAWGPSTTIGVKNFQRARGLTVDGKVGAGTRTQLAR